MQDWGKVGGTARAAADPDGRRRVDEPEPPPGAGAPPGDLPARPVPEAQPGDDGGPAGETATADAAGPPGAPARRKRWIPPQVRWPITAVVLFFVLEYLVLPELANARKSLDLLGRVNVGWLVAGVVFEGAALAAYAQLTHTVLSPGAPSRFRLFRVNMSSLAVSHVIPGGTASGTAVAYRLLTDLGVSGSTSAFALATQGVGSAVVLNGLLWLALLISVPLTGYNPLYGFAAIAGVILLGLFAGVVMLLTRGKRQAADRLTRLASHLPFVNPVTVAGLVQTVADRLEVLLRNRALLQRALWWAAANWLLDAASLWVFVFAFGHAVSPVDLLVAYGLANVLAVIPLTPGGLGVVEGVLIPTLVGFHVPKAVAILGVLSYRLVNFWLPIPAGGIAYLSLRFGPSARRHPSHGSVGPSHGVR
jgi:uncharacterized protein (TIRG00374 family)